MKKTTSILIKNSLIVVLVLLLVLIGYNAFNFPGVQKLNVAFKLDEELHVRLCNPSPALIIFYDTDLVGLSAVYRTPFSSENIEIDHIPNPHNWSSLGTDRTILPLQCDYKTFDIMPMISAALEIHEHDTLFSQKPFMKQRVFSIKFTLMLHNKITTFYLPARTNRFESQWFEIEGK